MRFLTVSHLTVYRYSEPVGLGEHRMMLRPRASHDLRLVKTSLAITPEPSELHWIHDVFDNSIAVASFNGKTEELRFESVVTIEHIESERPEYRLENAAGTNAYQAASGTNHWSATLADLVPGPNTIRVRAYDTSSNLSQTVARTFNFVVVSPINVIVTGSGTVSPNYSNKLLERHGMTLVGFLREPNFNVYAGSERVLDLS